MPTRPWDPPLVQPMSIWGGTRHAKKRSREDLEIDDGYSHCRIPPAISKTPFTSPDRDIGSTAPIDAVSQGLQGPVQTSQQNFSMPMDMFDTQSHLAPASQKPEPNSESVHSYTSAKRQRHMDMSVPESLFNDTGLEVQLSEEALSSHDEWKIAIGIGWETVGGDAITRKGLRGQERFAETHHDLSNVVILAKNTGLDFCLISTSEGWYLCSADLQRTRRTGSTREETIAFLQQTPLRLETPDDEMILD